jgi:hypothetical protein
MTMASSSSTNSTSLNGNNIVDNNSNNKTDGDNNNNDAYWSLSVKAIGSALKHCLEQQNEDGDAAAAAAAAELVGEKNFTVTVSPEDAVTSLYDQIEGITGLKASQQRLIYRGRLIHGGGTTTDHSSNKNESSSTKEKNGKAEPSATKTEEAEEEEEKSEQPKIKDIVGLGDGHTIHLIKRAETANSSSSSSTSRNHESSVENNNSNQDRDESGNGTASLLAALIGLGGLEDSESSSSESSSNNNNNTATTTTTTTANRTRFGGGWRSSTSRLGGGRSRGRPHYRLTAEDLETPDPGTLEPVRQGLMTLHTMLPHAHMFHNNTNSATVEATTTTEGDTPVPSPLDANRQWYRGQWIDVRDTVNQWLEATIVDIVLPDDILPPAPSSTNHRDNNNNNSREPILEPATDPAVGGGDLEGRRRLLLEPCDEGDEGDLGGELAGFRRRRTNAGVQLLLIHYNGWPHRWDEWIRGDSERIRPFRTRTRHPSMVRYFAWGYVGFGSAAKTF